MRRLSRFSSDGIRTTKTHSSFFFQLPHSFCAAGHLPLTGVESVDSRARKASSLAGASPFITSYHLDPHSRSPTAFSKSSLPQPMSTGDARLMLTPPPSCPTLAARMPMEPRISRAESRSVK